MTAFEKIIALWVGLIASLACFFIFGPPKGTAGGLTFFAIVIFWGGLSRLIKCPSCGEAVLGVEREGGGYSTFPAFPRQCPYCKHALD